MNILISFNGDGHLRMNLVSQVVGKYQPIEIDGFMDEDEIDRCCEYIDTAIEDDRLYIYGGYEDHLSFVDRLEKKYGVSVYFTALNAV